MIWCMITTSCAITTLRLSCGHVCMLSSTRAGDGCSSSHTYAYAMHTYRNSAATCFLEEPDGCQLFAWRTIRLEPSRYEVGTTPSTSSNCCCMSSSWTPISFLLVRHVEVISLQWTCGLSSHEAALPVMSHPSAAWIILGLRCLTQKQTLDSLEKQNKLVQTWVHIFASCG